MKRFPLALAALAIGLPLVGLTGCATTDDPTTVEPATAPDTATAPTDEVNYELWGLDVVKLKANGMSCPLCAHNLDKQFERIPAVKKIHTDLGTGEIFIGLDPDQPAPDANLFWEGTKDAGFTPVSLTMPDGTTKGGEE